MERIIACLKDNGGSSTILYIVDTLLALNVRRILAKHLKDNHGSLEIPEAVLRDIAKCLLPNIIAFFNTEEGKAEFAQWKEEQRKAQAENKKASADGN